MNERLLIVSPVFREKQNLDRTARAVAAQDRPPDRWVIVDDGSDDGTFETAQEWARELPYATAIRTEQTSLPADGLALARDARAFNIGLSVARWEDFSHIGKLDGDIALPKSWFSDLLALFRHNPELGVAGGRLVERSGEHWRVIPIPASHVHGAVKLYSRACLGALGGIQERLGWDTIDETFARMLGFETHSSPALVAEHHRPWGSAQGRLRGRARHGDAAWVLHQPFSWALLRGAKLSRVPPRGLSGAAFVYGYLRSAARGTPRVEDPEFRRFVRRELRVRVQSSFSRAGIVASNPPVGLTRPRGASASEPPLEETLAH